jgi:hypothetical protein
VEIRLKWCSPDGISDRSHGVRRRVAYRLDAGSAEMFERAVRAVPQE